MGHQRQPDSDGKSNFALFAFISEKSVEYMLKLTCTFQYFLLRQLQGFYI